jgi:hypothetical protein
MTDSKLAAEITCTIFKPSSVFGANIIGARSAAAGCCMYSLQDILRAQCQCYQVAAVVTSHPHLIDLN